MTSFESDYSFEQDHPADEFLDELDSLHEDAGDAKPTDTRAHFQTERLEERILFSASWIDADTGEDQETATAGDDLFVGSSQNDVAAGGDGDDVFEGLEGDDILDGGAGEDTAVFSGNAADYSITSNDDGTISVEHNVGSDGRDTLENIETLKFADQEIDSASLVPEVVNVEEDGSVSLPVELGDIPADSTEIILSGYPEGTSFSRGEDQGDGTWVVEVSDIPDLELTTAPDNSDDFQLEIFAPTTVESVDYISNGSFENVGATGVHGVTNDAEGWAVIEGGGLETWQKSYASSWLGDSGTVDGDRHVDLDYGGNVRIAQDVSGLNDGENYKLTFAYAGYTSTYRGEDSDGMEVIWNGEVVSTIDADHREFRDYDLNLVAGSGDGSNRIEFRAIGTADSWGAGLDNVRLESEEQQIDKFVANYDIQVSEVADQASLSVEPASGNEDSEIELNIKASVTDVSESISSITINGVPDGASLSAGTDNGDGTWSLSSEDLQGLTISPPENSHDDFDLIVDVTTADGDDRVTVSETISVEVYSVNDDVTDLTLSDNSIVENSPAGTVVGILSGVDADSNEDFGFEFVDELGNVVEDDNFEIVGDEIRVRDGANLDYESEDNYDVNIRVTESGGSTLTNSFSIKVANESGNIIGTDNRDVLVGTSEEDLIQGLDGNDIIRGGDGDDEIRGGGGIDYLYGESGDDRLFGEAGNDIIFGGDGNDTIDGGEGADWVFYGESDEGVNIDLNNGTATGGDAQGDQLTNIENLGGSTKDDVLIGDDGENLLYGNDGNDRLFGGDGDDILYDFSGTNELDAGAGDDIVYVFGGSNSVDAGSGNDTVYSYGGDVDVDAGSGDDTFYGGVSRDTQNVDGGAGNDRLTTGSSDDSITGGEGDDVIDGGLGDDAAVYSGDWADYNITGNEDGSFTIIDTRDGSPDGTDTVKNIENFQFADGSVGIDELLNAAPVSVNIDGTSVAENASPGTVVGTLTTVDNNSLDSFTYTLVDANGNVVEDDNFEIVDDQIVVKESADLDYETREVHSLNIRVTDSGGATRTESFEIEVSNINEGQVAFGESYEINEDGSVDGNLLENDYDIDGDELSISSFTQPASGQVSIDSAGNFQYQPTENFSGSDSFSYTITDGNGISSTQSVEIVVNSQADEVLLTVNDASGNEDTPIALDIQALLVDVDGSESISSITISNVPAGTNLSAGEDNGDGTWSLSSEDLQGLTISPPENSHGDFELEVTVVTADGDDQATVSATISVTVNSVNDAVSDLQLTTKAFAENSPAGTVVGRLSASDVDDNETFTYTLVDANGNVVEDDNFEIVDDQIVVKEDADLDYETRDVHSLNIRVTDSGGATRTESFEIGVSNINEGQVAFGESYQINEDGSVDGNLLENDYDIDGDELSISSFTQPTNGQVSIDSAGNFQYQPAENFSGSDSFSYTITDGNGITSTQSVEIEVNPQADEVLLTVGAASGNEDTPIALDIQALLADVDGSESIVDVSISGVPDGAALSAGVDNGDGTWLLKPHELQGLQVNLQGMANEDFELQINVRSRDGDTLAVASETIRVDVKHDTLTTIALEKILGSIGDGKSTQDQLGTGSDPDAHQPPIVAAGSQPIDGDNFAAAEAGTDAASVWHDSAWDGFDSQTEFSSEAERQSESNEATDFRSTTERTSGSPESTPTTLVDSGLLQAADSLSDPSQLVAETTQYFEQDKLADRLINLAGLDSMGLGDQTETAGLTAASLLMIFTSKEDDRKKLKKFNRSAGDQGSVGVESSQ